MVRYQLTIAIHRLLNEHRSILTGAKAISEGMTAFAIEARPEGSEGDWQPIVTDLIRGHIASGGPYIKVVSGKHADGHEFRVRTFGMCSTSDVAYTLKVTPDLTPAG